MELLSETDGGGGNGFSPCSRRRASARLPPCVLYMYMYYIHVHVCVHKHMHVCVHKHMHVCVHKHNYACIFTCEIVIIIFNSCHYPVNKLTMVTMVVHHQELCLKEGHQYEGLC